MKKKYLAIGLSVLIITVAVVIFLIFKPLEKKSNEEKNGIKDKINIEEKNDRENEIQPALFLTEDSAIEAVKTSFNVENNKLVLFKEEQDSWLIDEMENDKTIERYKVYKDTGVINRITIE